MRRSRRRLRIWPLPCAAVTVLAAGAAEADPPMSYLTGFGAKAYPVAALTWGVLAISIIVVITIAALVIAAIRRGRARAAALAPSHILPERGGVPWVIWGTGISSLVLLATVVWTVEVLAQVSGPPSKAPLTIEVTGKQWWWQVRYLNADPSRIITTANEIHIPVGQPVRVFLIGADVIHSFWIPALTGKTDAIPGQTNTMWLEADRPGTYRGQCTEYCGEQHAHMAAFVVAESPDAFQTWWDEQLRDAPPPSTAQQVQGEVDVVYRCGACHTVRGTGAGGTVAPDLTHLMSRQTIAAGALENTTASLAGWIGNPQAIKPGTRMPVLNLSGPELGDILAYLKTLR